MFFLLSFLPSFRFNAVTRPLYYAKHKTSRRHVYIMIIVPWFIAVAISSPIALGMNYTEKRREMPNLCTFYNSDFLIYSSMGSFYIPCIVMLLLYWRIYLKIRSRGRRRSSVAIPSHMISNGAALTKGGQTGETGGRKTLRCGAWRKKRYQCKRRRNGRIWEEKSQEINEDHSIENGEVVVVVESSESLVLSPVLREPPIDLLANLDVLNMSLAKRDNDNGVQVKKIRGAQRCRMTSGCFDLSWCLTARNVYFGRDRKRDQTEDTKNQSKEFREMGLDLISPATGLLTTQCNSVSPPPSCRRSSGMESSRVPPAQVEGRGNTGESQKCCQHRSRGSMIPLVTKISLRVRQRHSTDGNDTRRSMRLECKATKTLA